MLKFVIPGKPLTWKAPYVSCNGAYSVRTPIMQQIKAQLREQMFRDRECIISDPMAILLIVYSAIPKSVSKKKREQILTGQCRPLGGGDRSNYTKFYEDCLQGCVITNDNLIVDGREAKLYGDPPRTEIYVFTIEEFEKIYGNINRISLAI